MSGEAAPKRIPELLPQPERSSINLPSRRQLLSESAHSDSNAKRDGDDGDAPSTGEAMARPNLNIGTGGVKDNRQVPHVMSWMDYDNGTPSPTR